MNGATDKDLQSGGPAIAQPARIDDDPTTLALGMAAGAAEGSLQTTGHDRSVVAVQLAVEGKDLKDDWLSGKRTRNPTLGESRLKGVVRVPVLRVGACAQWTGHSVITTFISNPYDLYQ